jgi:hypothetical protein
LTKNPISFAFSVVFEIAAVVAIVSVLPRINLRPAASASQSPAQAIPIQTTNLQTTSPRPWFNAGHSYEQSAPPLIEAAPASPQYVEQQLDRASQRLLNSVGGAVNQASQDWMRPLPPQTAPIDALRPSVSPPQNDFAMQPPAKQMAHMPTRSPAATPRPTTEARPWLRY